MAESEQDQQRLLRHMRRFLDRPFIQDDFIFMSVFSFILREEIFTKEELADGLVGAVPSLDRWFRGRNLPGPSIREALFRGVRSMLDRKFPTLKDR